MKSQSSDEGWWRFLELCQRLTTTEQLNQLLTLFLTANEKEDLATRYLIVRELLNGQKTQRDMAHDLQVSIAKITRGSNSLKTVDDRLRRFLVENMT